MTKGTKKEHFKVLISDDLARQGVELFQKEPLLELDVRTKMSPAELRAEIKNYDALVIRSGTQVTKEVVEEAERLRVIGRAGVGLDNVDVEAASKKGIIVINSPGGNTISAAEHTWSLLLSLARNVPAAHMTLKQGLWDRKRFTGVELHDKTLGILGLGRIGAEVARRAMSFGMKVIAYDPFLRVEKAQQAGVELVEKEDLLKRADFITLHLPLTAETKYTIGQGELKKVKKNVRIINCARGGLIDEQALADAIKDKRVAGAALDVFEKEPPGDSPLFHLDQVVVTPHLGASTEEAQVQVAVDIAQGVIDALLGRGVRNAVNFPCVDPEVLKELEPYLVLAEKIGLLQAQLIEGHITQVNINYSGEIIRFELAPVSVAVIKGLLSRIMAENVNYVNASLLAKERGIKVIESKSSDLTNFANLISVEVVTDKRKSAVSGTLFTKEDPRLVMIDGFHVETVPTGYMLLISNHDVPGIVGQIGTILGRNNINIAGMTLGRNKTGGEAKTLLNVDSPVNDSVIQELKQAKNIIDAKLIKL